VTADDEVLVEPEVDSHDHVIMESRISANDESGNEQDSDTTNNRKSSFPFGVQPYHNKTSNNNATNKVLISEGFTSCPLPKKKRPLPKEFLSESEPTLKTVKDDSVVSSNNSIRSFDGTDITNTIATSLTNTVTLKSKTTRALSIACPVTNTNSIIANEKESFQPNPKVVVQLTQSCDSYLPIACSQFYLKNRLSGLTAESF